MNITTLIHEEGNSFRFLVTSLVSFSSVKFFNINVSLARFTPWCF